MSLPKHAAISPLPLPPQPASPSPSDTSDEAPAVPLPPPVAKTKLVLPDSKETNSPSQVQTKKRRRQAQGTERINPPAKKVRQRALPSMSHLPSNPLYQRSYMHRTIITHITVTASTVVSASEDGRITFWHRDAPLQKPQSTDDTNGTTPPSSKTTLTFIKSFQAHRGPLSAMHLTQRQDTLLTTSASDQSLKVFNVTTFDMAQFTTLSSIPADSLSSIASPDRVIVPFRERAVLAVLPLSDVSTPPLYIRTPNATPLTQVLHNAPYETLITCDTSSILDYARVPLHKPRVVIPDADTDEDDKDEDADAGGNASQSGGRDNIGPFETLSHDIPHVAFQSRLRTDLYALAKAQTKLTNMSMSPHGTHFATMSLDRRVRVFTFKTAKIWRVYDETHGKVDIPLSVITTQQLTRRLARDRQATGDLATARRANVEWDETGSFVVYATVAGVKVVHVESNRVAFLLGLRESAVRFVRVGLACGQGSVAALYGEGGEGGGGPLLVASAFDSERIYLFGRGEEVAETNRDVYNERRVQSGRRHLADERAVKSVGDDNAALAKRCTLHTSVGDVVIELWADRAKRSVENFVTHGRNGYFNGVVFHRVIKGFMVQTGDPDGDGTGGESIWGGTFDDEIDDELKHDIGTISMANSGPNTNGSQFFIVTGKASHLDGKHTIFGKVVKGMGVVRQIEGAKTDKRDHPIVPMRIESVSIKE